MRYLPPSGHDSDAFHNGTNRFAYRMLGAHPVVQDGREMWHFAVWAPNARRVCLVGEFNEWRQGVTFLDKQYDGIWEIRLDAELFSVSRDRKKYSYPDAAEKLKTYKYAIQGQDGEWHQKSDPYGFLMQVRPQNATCLYDLDSYRWKDSEWMQSRSSHQLNREAMNIYELHLGTWRRKEDGSFFSYREIAKPLADYVCRMGYTHVEFLPVMEHPLDGSWGYQVTGFFAATSRYGTPDGLRYLIDTLHRRGIGVILDWVPAHFPRNEEGLYHFDGQPCYEHADPRRAEMPQWGTNLFDFARGEVRSFLLSSACFWLEQFHADGLRVDAVSCLLYHDFCREPGQWLPNEDGGRENREAISFLQMLNTVVYRDFPGVTMIAEESSAYPQVTGRVCDGGLGFGFKWNMGWMNDMLAYVKDDPIYRSYHHDKLTFSLMYAFSENYILPFSHDEVVHGKHSMLDKQPGDLWQKFAGLRALYGYTMAHPGKKLLFMGGEFGQFIEWKDSDQLDWFLLVYERHPEMQKYVRALNLFYKKTPAFFQQDRSWEGFSWLNADDKERSIASFLRTADDGTTVAVVVNFTPVTYPDYCLPLPCGGVLTEILNSDSEEFGGSGVRNGKPVYARKSPLMNQPYSCTVVVPPYGCVYYRFTKRKIQVRSGKT